MQDLPPDPFTVLVRIDERQPDGTIRATLIPDEATVHLNDGDEFFTGTFVCDVFGERS